MAYRPKLRTRKSVVTSPRAVLKVGRNDPCPCGSGKKYKDCHQNDGDVFLRKMAQKRGEKDLAERRAQMKEEGVPFWKRWFGGK